MVRFHLTGDRSWDLLESFNMTEGGIPGTFSRPSLLVGSIGKSVSHWKSFPVFSVKPRITASTLTDFGETEPPPNSCVRGPLRRTCLFQYGYSFYRVTVHLISPFGSDWGA